MPSLNDYLNPSPSACRQQWDALLARSWPAAGKRQEVFLPLETVLCLAASLRVDHRRFGSSTAAGAPSPAPELADLFKRPNTSVLAKMANLDGSRSHGGRFDQEVAQVLREDAAKLGTIYRSILSGARAAGIDSRRLPDFLSVENGGVPKDYVIY